MHIGIAGPIATEDILPHLNEADGTLPPGYIGAPLLGTLIDEFLRRGHRVSAFTTSPGAPFPSSGRVIARGNRFQIYYCGARPHSFRPKHGHLGRAMDMFALERRCLCDAIRHAAPDVVHGHWVYEFGLAAIESGVPCVVTCHDAPQVVLRYMPNLYRLIRYWMGRRCLRQASTVTAVSPYLQGKIQRYTPASVFIVPNPLPPAILENDLKTRNKERTLDRPIVCMVLNGWGRRKNPIPALLAFQILRREIPFTELRLYGTNFGPGEIAESWSIRNGASDNVRFMGRLPYSSLLEELAAGHIMVHPALEESFGMTVIESMAIGLPVIGGFGCGAVQWVIGDGGIVTDVSSPQAIASALLMLLKDPEAYTTRAAAARARAKACFSVQSVADQYERQYALATGHALKPEWPLGGQEKKPCAGEMSG